MEDREKNTNNSKLTTIIIVGIILAVGIGVVVMGGGGKQSSEITMQDESTQLQAVQDRSPRVPPGAATGTVQDLVADAQVFAVGSANDDGSLLAEWIRVGEFKQDETLFQEEVDETQLVQDQVETLSNGMTLDEIRALPEDERRAIMTELRESGELPEGGGMGMRDGSGESRPSLNADTTARGTILLVDDISITVSLEGGGTRLVYLSDNTSVFVPQKDELK